MTFVNAIYKTKMEMKGIDPPASKHRADVSALPSELHPPYLSAHSNFNVI